MATATQVYSAGSCAGATVEYSVEGSRRETTCGSGGEGPFDGYWNIEWSLTTDECNLSGDPTCSQFIQSGDTVYIVDLGVSGSVSGNTAVFSQVQEDQGVRLTIEAELTVSGDGNSFDGTQTITIEYLGTSLSCTSSGDVTGTRTSSCDGGGGLRIPVPAAEK
jgi:hypothetical protein